MPEHLAASVAASDPDQRPDAAVEAPVDAASDPTWAAWDAPRPFNRTTGVLGVALIAVLAFGGGIITQQHTGTSSAASASMPAGLQRGSGASGFPGMAGMPSGMPGGMPGFAGGDASGSGAGSAAGSGAESGAGAATATRTVPLVVGTVVSVPPATGGTLVVRNFCGTTVKVTVPKTVTVTVTGLTGRLAPGSKVSVVGTKAADGTITASAITVR